MVLRQRKKSSKETRQSWDDLLEEFEKDEIKRLNELRQIEAEQIFNNPMQKFGGHIKYQ
jgi:hypothetical protein